MLVNIPRHYQHNNTDHCDTHLGIGILADGGDQLVHDVKVVFKV